MKFILDNIILIALALVSGGLLLWPLVRRSGASNALGPLEATQMINHRNAIVIDLRDEKDFAIGSLAGARNLPFAQLDARASEFARFKARPVLLVCDAGQQSGKAIAVFRAQGFEEAHALAGGIAAWKQGGLPLVQPGRDNTRVAGKDVVRKRDNRPGDRNKGARTPRAPAPVSLVKSATSPVIAAPVDASIVLGDASVVPVEPAAAPNAVDPSIPAVDADAPTRADADASTQPNRVKELS